MAVTVRDIIKDSLRLISAIATGETPSAEEINDSKSALSMMLDSWSTEKMIVPALTIETFSLVVGQRVYTMGPSGDFDTTRPLEVEKVLFNESGANSPFDLPVKIMTDEEYSQIRLKDTESTIPTVVYPQMNTPLISLYFYPIPSVAKTIKIYSHKVLNSITSVNDELNLPPGYLRAIKYNLAVEVAPEYGIEPSMAIVSLAKEAKSNIKRLNKKTHLLKADPAFMTRGAGFSYRTGE